MENISKNKRGRPRKISKSFEESLQMIYPELKSVRSINNINYLNDTIELLKDKEGFEYLIDGKKQELKHKTILTALGRIIEKYSNGEQLALELATDICNHKLNTQKAIDFINRFRKANGDNVGKNKTQGALKKVINVIQNAHLDQEEVSKLIKVLALIDITELSK